MDIKKRILTLNEQRGWSLYRLAAEAKISASTMTNMFRRGTSPSLETVERICQAYEMSLSEFFSEESQSEWIDREDFIHLKTWHSLDTQKKRAVDS